MKLALDIGTTSGWATAFDSGQRSSGSIKLKAHQFANWASRMTKMRGLLDGLHTLEPIEEVWFEEVRRHNGVAAAHVYGALMGTVAEWCDLRDIPYSGVSVGTIKKFATGSGNASKERMISAVKEKWRANVKDDNEADAIALLECQMENEK